MGLGSWRWKVGVGLLLALAAYAALGFWFVPWFVQREASRYIVQVLHRQGGIGSLRFNPFTLRLEAADLTLAEADGAPLARVGSLDVSLRWRSLTSRAWHFGPIRIGQPTAYLRIAPDGRFNIAELLQSLPPSQPAAEPAALPRLVIERLAVEDGLVQIQDRQAGYDNTITPIGFELDDFNTLADGGDTHTLSAQSRYGGKLLWRGHLSLQPLRATGELVLENASLGELAAYIKPRVAGLVQLEGRLAATLPYTVEYAGGRLDVHLNGARLGLQGLALDWQGLQGRVDSGELGLTAHLARAGNGPLQFSASGGNLSMTDLHLAKAGLAPLALTRLAVREAALDLQARRLRAGKLALEGLDLDVQRDPQGAISLLRWLPAQGGKPAAGSGADAPPTPAWAAQVDRIELSRSRLAFADAGSGVHLRLAAIDATVLGAGTDLDKPLTFDADVQVQEGGRLSAQGTLVPATAALQAQVQVAGLALKPVEPLLARFVKLRIGGGKVDARGRLDTGGGSARAPALRYAGSLDVAGFALRETTGELFAGWKRLSAPQLTLALAPNRLDIPELRLTGADAKLIIEENRSLNAARLLVRPPAAAASAATAAAAPASAAAAPVQAQAQAQAVASAPARPAAKPAAAPAPAGDPFPVRIRRLRVANSRLEFTDLSLRPQFSARIYELGGAVNGISSSGSARSQIALEGRVDEFGLARIEGELNPFVPRFNTDVRFSFRNVDMVPASPYSMKFAGYRIASGRISLDLDYKVREGRLEGNNHVVIDKLTLGERVDSPDALKIPLQLALAILTDSDGRIDLGLPVSGDLDDPQFSYGALIWKAITNVLTKVVTAPFRALGSLLGVSGNSLEAIAFDPGSSRLLPPEREKLGQVAQALAKRGNLRLEVPASYSEAADGAALREDALRRELLARAGVKLQPGEAPGPLDLGDRKLRSAMRELYAKRFGDGELDKARKAAEAEAGRAAAQSAARAGGGATGAGAPAAAPATPAAPVPLWQRAANLISGEPQVADASAFYRALHDRLAREQPLPADALPALGRARAQQLLSALAQAGVDGTRASAAAPAAVESAPGKPVPLKLGLAPR
ncbi:MULTISPECIES: DUF748 domain-containing protein [Ramlibacter]|uniref:DUF748 domain-containing protein n=1 Tax=Ramlibacter aquaticus TaxID=2780094 RepID=A0ABR9SJM8_9BURK|nr:MULTISPECIES: DUF748 domain-containing protein [Ramlibacter]MBE7942564.1 DUF748 domain-containing protein [Ramlibacter aquaticus]